MPKLRTAKRAQKAGKGMGVQSAKLRLHWCTGCLRRTSIKATASSWVATAAGRRAQEPPVGKGRAGVFGSPRSEGRGQTKQLPYRSRRIPYTPPPSVAAAGEIPAGCVRGAVTSPNHQKVPHPKMTLSAVVPAVVGSGTNSIPSWGYAVLEWRLCRRCLRPRMWSLTCPSSRRRN